MSRTTDSTEPPVSIKRTWRGVACREVLHVRVLAVHAVRDQTERPTLRRPRHMQRDEESGVAQSHAVRDALDVVCQVSSDGGVAGVREVAVLAVQQPRSPHRA